MRTEVKFATLLDEGNECRWQARAAQDLFHLGEQEGCRTKVVVHESETNAFLQNQTAWSGKDFGRYDRQECIHLLSRLQKRIPLHEKAHPPSLPGEFEVRPRVKFEGALLAIEFFTCLLEQSKSLLTRSEDGARAKFPQTIEYGLGMALRFG